MCVSDPAISASAELLERGSLLYNLRFLAIHGGRLGRFDSILSFRNACINGDLFLNGESARNCGDV